MDVETPGLPAVVHDALERGAVVITANQRAARSLRLAFDRREKTRGREAWRPAEILSWEAWTASLWRELLLEGATQKLLLNQVQEHTLWRSILQADEQLNTLRTLDHLAEMSAEAWRTLCRYNGLSRIRFTPVSADTRAFQRWSRSFARRCEADGYLTRAELDGAITAALLAGQLHPPQREIALVGFDATTPSQDALLRALEDLGIAVTPLPLGLSENRQWQVAATDEDSELLAAAWWIRSQLERNPVAQVALIVPGLDTERTRIDRALRTVLAPQLDDIAVHRSRAPWEFSIGVPLVETAMVDVALDLLRWTMGPLPLERVSRLLLSRYFAAGVEAERGARSEFDAFEVRRPKVKLLRPDLSLAWVKRALERSPRKTSLSHLHLAIHSLDQATRHSSAQTQSLTAWGEHFRELLEAAAWASRDTLDGVEFQNRVKWETALDQLATLDYAGARVSATEALQSLDWIARQTIFAPESREAPVQVMGPLEAAGSVFDAVWLMRANDVTWPMPASLSPLLPWLLQHDLGLPGADAELDRERARLLTGRIATSGAAVVISYAQQSADGQQRLSPIVSALGLENLDPASLPTAAPHRPVSLEPIDDLQQLPALPDAVVRGGASVLQAQAACGFRAFAERRLWSSEIETSEPGLDPQRQGVVVHLVLQAFWNEVQSQSALLGMSHQDLAQTLDRSIDSALERFANEQSSTWDQAYLDTQRLRLHNLIRPWLTFEKTRPDFTVKRSEEAFRDVQVGPLRLDVRVDRIDTTEFGEVVIDYKTGKASPSHWLSNRPDAPQLPLYAILPRETPLAGVAFAQIRAGKDLKLQGFQQANALGIKPSKVQSLPLADHVEQWRTVLTTLAENFASGEAAVAPKRYPLTCQHCGQRLLCRLDASALEQEALEDDDAETEDYDG